ncbi:uncharacterized protein [Gossypium hirsutum]|uniref:Uncharacterized protein n=1 Tax=Gossypium hirsutum TaxID=3635 RepID=A0ABM3AFN2_GOSHI|nr:uncharacterized protein LOC107932222 [Gossypium hirsutum]
MRNRNGSPPSSLDSVQTEKNSDSADGSRFRWWARWSRWECQTRGRRGGQGRGVRVATGQRRACVRGADEAERRALGMLRLGFSAANICFFFIWARVSAIGLGSGLNFGFVIF